MPSRAWVVTMWVYHSRITRAVSMPSRAWVVTPYRNLHMLLRAVSMPSRAWVVTQHLPETPQAPVFQCPHGLELLQIWWKIVDWLRSVSMPSRAWVVTPCYIISTSYNSCVSMPSRAWVVTWNYCCRVVIFYVFQCPHGLELLPQECPIF